MNLNGATETLMTDVADILAFVTAGNAYFTIQSGDKRYTFRISTNKKYHNLTVGLLAGPQNTSDYTGLGFIKNGEFKPWPNMMDSTPAKAITWLLARCQNPQPLSDVKFWHYGHCGKCGKLLTVPESIAMGLGPKCAAGWAGLAHLRTI